MPAELTRVCVYAGSNAGANPRFRQAAGELARAIMGRGAGSSPEGYIGLTGALADSGLAAGGMVIGVIPEALLAREVGHARLSELIVVGSMHERKERMADLADAFIALPGEISTLDELIEVITSNRPGITTA